MQSPVFLYDATAYSDPTGASLDQVTNLVASLLQGAAAGSVLSTPIPPSVCQYLTALAIFRTSYLDCNDGSITYAKVVSDAVLPVLEQATKNLRINISTTISFTCDATGSIDKQPVAAYAGEAEDDNNNRFYQFTIAHPCVCMANRTNAQCSEEYRERTLPLSEFYDTHFGHPTERCRAVYRTWIRVALLFSVVSVLVIWTADCWARRSLCLVSPFRGLGVFDLLTPLNNMLIRGQDTAYQVAAFGSLIVTITNLLLLALQQGVPSALVVQTTLMSLPLFIGLNTYRPLLGCILILCYAITGWGFSLDITVCLAGAGNVYESFTYFPALVCFAFAIILTVKRLVTNGLTESWKPRDSTVQLLERIDRRQYVRSLLEQKPAQETPTAWRRFHRMPKAAKSNPGFKLSPRLVTVVVLSGLTAWTTMTYWSMACELIALAAENFLSGGRCCRAADCFKNPAEKAFVGSTVLESVGLYR